VCSQAWLLGGGCWGLDFNLPSSYHDTQEYFLFCGCLFWIYFDVAEGTYIVQYELCFLF